MLGEAFLSVLPYRGRPRQTEPPRTRHSHGGKETQLSTESDPLSLPLRSDLYWEEVGQSQSHGVSTGRGRTVTIPGCPPCIIEHPPPSASLDCSLLQHYPDLRLGHEGGEQGDSCSPGSIPLQGYNPHSRSTDHVDSLLFMQPQCWGQRKPNRELGRPLPDQGYLVMGAGTAPSLGLPGSGLEPMSNSLLNGFLERQLEEVYRQHLTDSLARCSSEPENSLLRGLVPPPQRVSQPQGQDSLEASLEVGQEERSQSIGYLNTECTTPYSTNFSSPLLRISETENHAPQGPIHLNYIPTSD